MADPMPKRKYAMGRTLRPSDWLWLSNDGKTLWRLATYEDGPSHGLEVDWKSDRKFWGLWKWREPVRGLTRADLEDWNAWDFYGGMFETRGEALDEAMKLGGES